jgi:RimJ/RimL family protein N-acetyltransferase
MTKTLEEVELQFRTPRQNHPGYNNPLEFRPLKNTDSQLLTPVFQKYGKTIRGYLGSFHNAHSWQIGDAQKFVSKEVDAAFPNFTWLFFIGKELVGMGSIHPYANSLVDVQIVLAVFGKHQGKGIGTAIGGTLKSVAFDIWGFQSFWWLVDATNHPSKKAAEKVGLSFHHSWEDEVKHSESESGLWFAYSEQRPMDCADAILQGAPLAYWQESRTSSLLQAVINAKGERLGMGSRSSQN